MEPSLDLVDADPTRPPSAMTSVSVVSSSKIDELRLIIDVYKHHWDTLLKGFGLYLIACSVLVGYGLSQQADLYNKIFSSVAIIVASIINFLGMNLALSWTQHTAGLAEDLARSQNFSVISFAHGVTGIKILRLVSIFMIVSGVLYLINVILISNGINLINIQNSSKQQ